MIQVRAEPHKQGGYMICDCKYTQFPWTSIWETSHAHVLTEPVQQFVSVNTFPGKPSGQVPGDYDEQFRRCKSMKFSELALQQLSKSNRFWSSKR